MREVKETVLKICPPECNIESGKGWMQRTSLELSSGTAVRCNRAKPGVGTPVEIQDLEGLERLRTWTWRRVPDIRRSFHRAGQDDL